MKECNKCLVEKDLSEFGKRKDGADGREAVCKLCVQKRKKAYRETPKGLLVNIAKSQKHNSKERGFKPVAYTSSELCERFLNDSRYIELFNDWKESGFKNGLSPSIDRIDDYRGYSLDNIQLMTWDENRAKSHIDSIEGRNRKRLRAVISTCIKTGEEEEWYSISNASRTLKISSGNIGSVCSGTRNKCGGYRWRYKT